LTARGRRSESAGANSVKPGLFAKFSLKVFHQMPAKVLSFQFRVEKTSNKIHARLSPVEKVGANLRTSSSFLIPPLPLKRHEARFGVGASEVVKAEKASSEAG